MSKLGLGKKHQNIKPRIFSLPDNLLLGTATASTQVEGSSDPNSWLDWSAKGYIKDGTTPLIAADHYNRYKEDFDLMSKMGMQIYRMGIEWSRIEKEPGVFDQKVIEHYRNMISYLQKKDIKVLVTLHHFTNPQWFEEMGAFENEESIHLFLRFAQFVISSLQDLVDEWITFNEINVYAIHGFFFGIWPPGKKSINAVRKVYTNMVIAHIKTYKAIHELYTKKGKTVRVGLAHHYRIFKAYHWWNPLHQLSAKGFDYLFQMSLTKSCASGKLTALMIQKVFKKHGIKKGNYHDFLGVNYYARDGVTLFKQKNFPHKKYNDLEWEIYPEGISQIISRLYALYKKPIYITENGTCDAKDAFRSEYIYEHLRELSILHSSKNIPIERYYHWSFLDNFEWLEGESGKFGIVEIDYKAQKRSMRKSGMFYAQIIADSGVSEEALSTFLPHF